MIVSLYGLKDQWVWHHIVRFKYKVVTYAGVTRGGGSLG